MISLSYAALSFASPSAFGTAGVAAPSAVLQRLAASSPQMGFTAAELVAAPTPKLVYPEEHNILLRCARGEEVERTPVWLMRQAGRYMSAFREYSTKYEFRQRSETPDIAIELSLQPYKSFKTDGVIMFSDILTPLPALGIEFDIVKGKGPQIAGALMQPAWQMREGSC